jgi:hypothetical protein
MQCMPFKELHPKLYSPPNCRPDWLLLWRPGRTISSIPSRKQVEHLQTTLVLALVASISVLLILLVVARFVTPPCLANDMIVHQWGEEVYCWAIL